MLQRMDNPLAQLALDYWYKVLVVVGAVLFVLTAAGLTPNLPAERALWCSAGVFFVGIGEWINHPLQTKIVAGSAAFGRGVISGHPRHASVLGTVFLLLGLALIGRGVWP